MPELIEEHPEVRPTAGWRVIAGKELGDHVLSTRFVVLFAAVAVVAAGTVISASGAIRDVAPQALGIHALFLKLFTVRVDPVPFPLMTFMAFIAPLIGIMFGFNTVNAERSQGTLPRLLAQPIHRDEVILGKFLGGLAVVALMVLSVVTVITGVALLRLGVVPDPAEITRLLLWSVLTVIYIGLWQAAATLASVLVRHTATAALIPAAIWIVVTLFGSLLVGLVADAVAPADGPSGDPLAHARAERAISQASPVVLYQDASSVLLDPETRTLGIVSFAQLDRAITAPLTLVQSLQVVWPQVVGLLAMTAALFGMAFVAFMRQDVRA